MEGSAILEEKGGGIFKDLLVPLPVHHAVFREEIQASPASFASKTPPHHNTGRVLDSFNDKSVLVEAHRLSIAVRRVFSIKNWASKMKQLQAPTADLR